MRSWEKFFEEQFESPEITPETNIAPSPTPILPQPAIPAAPVVPQIVAVDVSAGFETSAIPLHKEVEEKGRKNVTESYPSPLAVVEGKNEMGGL